MIEKEVTVCQIISVTVDETKFTEEFLKEFRESFYPYSDINDHIAHLGDLYARGIVDEFSHFIEGYGDPKDFGIKFLPVYTYTEDFPND